MVTTDHLEINLLLSSYLLDAAGSSLGNHREVTVSDCSCVTSSRWTERCGRTTQILFNLLPALRAGVCSVGLNLCHFDENRRGQGISWAGLLKHSEIHHAC